MKHLILLIGIAVLVGGCRAENYQPESLELELERDIERYKSEHPELAELEEAVLANNVRAAKKIMDQNEDEDKDFEDQFHFYMYRSLVTEAVKKNSLEMVKTIFPPNSSSPETDFTLGAVSVAVGAVALIGGLVGAAVVGGAAALGVGGGLLPLIGFMSVQSGSGLLHSRERRADQLENPLHIAVEQGYFDIVEYLVDEHEVWIFFENEQGQDAIEIAETHNQTKIANYLKEEKLSVGQIRQIFIFTDYLDKEAKKEGKKRADTNYMQGKALSFSLTSSDEEKEELYQYARNYKNFYRD